MTFCVKDKSICFCVNKFYRNVSTKPKITFETFVVKQSASNIGIPSQTLLDYHNSNFSFVFHNFLTICYKKNLLWCEDTLPILFVIAFFTSLPPSLPLPPNNIFQENHPIRNITLLISFRQRLILIPWNILRFKF